MVVSGPAAFDPSPWHVSKCCIRCRARSLFFFCSHERFWLYDLAFIDDEISCRADLGIRDAAKHDRRSSVGLTAIWACKRTSKRVRIRFSANLTLV